MKKQESITPGLCYGVRRQNREDQDEARPGKGPRNRWCQWSRAEIESFPPQEEPREKAWYSTCSEKQEAKPKLKKTSPRGREHEGSGSVKGVKTGTPKTTCGKTMRMTAVLGNTEATNASARHQGAPGEEKGK